MKYILGIVFCGMLLAGCGKETEQKPANNQNKYAVDSSDMKLTSATDPNQEFHLEYKMQKGKEYNYRLTTITKDNRQISGDTTVHQNMSQNLIYLFNLKVVDVDNQGVMELEGKVNSVKMTQSAGNQSVTYESDKSDSSTRSKFSDYEALVNSPFSVRVSKTGEIVEIFRVDRILNKFLKLKGYTDSASAEQKNLIRKDISEGAVRQLMMQIFKEYPTKAFAKDSAWTKSLPESRFLIFNTKNTGKYKIDNLEMLGSDKIAVIDQLLEVNLSGQQKINDRGIAYNFAKPTTNAEGKVYFNLNKGLIQKSKNKTVINIAFTAEGPTPQGIKKMGQKQYMETVNLVELM